MSMLGVVTIGQSPRVDMMPELLPRLGIPASEVVERGALDGMSADEIAALAPHPDSHEVLTTRLADGSSVVLDHDAAIGAVQRAIDTVEPTVDATLVVCTGTFPPMRHNKPLLFAEPLLLGGVAALGAGERVGVVCPLPEQEEMSRAKWRPVAGEITVASATPYAADPVPAIAAAAARLASAGATRIVLDCMGYTEAMRAAARESAGVPVLLARSVVARLAGEVAA